MSRKTKQRSQPSELRNNEGKDRQKMVSQLMLHPEFSAAIAINDIYGNTHFSEGNDNIKGLDLSTLMDELKKKTDALANDKLSNAEMLLLSQAQTLNAIFNQFLTRMTRAEYLSQIENYSRIALKAQNQCRQTLATLGELKHPRRATFIRQQNNAVNQQINQSGSAEQNSKNSDKLETELLEQKTHERLDFGAPQKTSRTDPEVAAMGAIDGAKD